MNADNNGGEWMILSVKRDRKEKNRYHLSDGGEEPVLSVHEDTLVRYRLMKGSVLSAELTEEIRNEDERYRAYAAAAAYLGAKPRTGKQIRQYLAGKEFEEEHIEYALSRLESERFVDDRQYARQFAQSRLRTGMKGRLMIQQELRQRGVSKSAASEAVTELDREDELEAAVKLAAKKSRSLKGDAAARRMKLTAFLLRRGFPADIAREAVRSAALESDETIEGGDGTDWLDN